MAIVEMTRAQVIKALKTETLRQGAFLECYDDKPAPHCPACAVGAVVRACMATTTPSQCVYDVAYDRGSIDEYLSALSEAFEHAAPRKARKAAVDFVRTYFPARVRINIGNAKPRRGMKVVEQ